MDDINFLLFLNYLFLFVLRADILDDEFVISPRDKPPEEQETQCAKHQMVFSITVDDWRVFSNLNRHIKYYCK